MKYSRRTHIITLLLIFLISCQAKTPSANNSSKVSVPETVLTGALTQVSPTFFPPTPTPDPKNISPNNVEQLSLQSINLGSSIETRYSWDGKLLYISSTAGIYSLDTTSYKEIHQVSSIPRGTLSPNGKLILSGNGASVFSSIGDQKLYDLQAIPGVPEKSHLRAPIFSDNGSLVAQQYYAAGNWFAIWLLNDGKLINVFHGDDIEFSADSRLAAVLVHEPDQVYDEQDNAYRSIVRDHVFLYDLQTGKLVKDWMATRPIFLSDNSLAMEADGYVQILDSKTYRARHAFAGSFAAFSPDEQIVATISNDHINIFQVSDGKLLYQLDEKIYNIYKADLEFSADGQFLAATTVLWQGPDSQRHNLSLWRIENVKLIKSLLPKSLMFSPDGQTMLLGNQMLRISDGSLIAELPSVFIGRVDNLAFTPDGQQIIVQNYKDLYLYSVNEEKQLWLPQVANPEIYLPILQAASPAPDFEFDIAWNEIPAQIIHSPDGRYSGKDRTRSCNH